MALLNSLLNFNMNSIQPIFNLNFGHFFMPNFSINMPFFNTFSYFSPIQAFQSYGNMTLFNNPNAYNFGQNFSALNTYYSSQFNNYDFSNSWQNSFSFSNMDTFSYSTTPSHSTIGNSSSKGASSKKYTYDSTKDKYASSNSSFLKDLTPKMQEKTKQLIAFANSKGYDIRIVSGKRSSEQQQALIDKDEEKGTHYAAKSNSPHLSGIAIDIQVFKDGKKLENSSPDIVKYAKNTLGMRWGGDFVNFTKEAWHFDLRKA